MGARSAASRCAGALTPVFVGALLLATGGARLARAAEHPFLIVKTADFAALQARAERSPWKEMRQAALDFMSSDKSRLGATPTHAAVRAIASHGALAFMLDPAGAASHRDKVRDALLRWKDLRDQQDDPGNWNEMVPPGSSLFLSILALDIVHDALTATERAAIEAQLDAAVALIGGAWRANVHGTHGLWALYKGDAARAKENVDGYLRDLEGIIDDDGVSTTSSGYSWARYAGDVQRGPAKSHFMDVLAFTGTRAMYDDPRLGRFYEWLLTFAMTPIRRQQLNGDTRPGTSASVLDMHLGPRSFSMHRFSERAGRLAAWLRQGARKAFSTENLLLTYVLADSLSTPMKPRSRVWPTGGAAFWEDSPSDRSLYASLWNPTRSSGHWHIDANSVMLVGYGELLLVNSGYAGYRVGIDDRFDWDWIRMTSESNNVVVVDGVTRYPDLQPRGGGVSEGFVGAGIDYASGASGPSLKVGTLDRNLLFVHPQDGLPGYAVVVDEISVPRAARVNVVWHPDQNRPTVVREGELYRFAINRLTKQDVTLSVLLGAPNANATLRDGGVASYGDIQSFVTKFLDAEWRTTGATKLSLPTVLFPSEATRPPPALMRLAGSGYAGARIEQEGGVTDTLLTRPDEGELGEGAVRAHGRVALFRASPDGARFFFVRKATSFDDGTNAHRGFRANGPVSLQLGANGGAISSAGVELTLRWPAVDRLWVGGEEAKIIERGSDFIRVAMPAGTHRLTWGASPPTDEPGSGGQGHAAPDGGASGPSDAVDDPAPIEGPDEPGAAAGGCACSTGSKGRTPVFPSLLLVLVVLAARVRRTRG